MTDWAILEVVAEAYRRPFTVGSNFARDNRKIVSEAASQGLITVYYPTITKAPGEGFDMVEFTDYTWRVTPEGLDALLNEVKETDDHE
jgi:hypothetical protein